MTFCFHNKLTKCPLNFNVFIHYFNVCYTLCTVQWHVIRLALNMLFPYEANGRADWEININAQWKGYASFISSIASKLFKNRCWKHFAVYDGCTLGLIPFHFRRCLKLCLSLTFFMVPGWRDSNSKMIFQEDIGVNY